MRMKNRLRSEMLEKRDRMSLDDNKRFSDTICRSIIALSSYEAAKTVMCFLSFRSEINTKTLVLNILESGRRLVVPTVDFETKTLRLSHLESMADLVPGPYGILEPKASAFRPAAPAEPDIILVPGAVFDLKGHRIGYGGGYFDKFLPMTRADALSIGLCFDFQIVPSVDPLAHDRPVDLVVSEKRMIKAKTTNQMESGEV